MKLINKSALAAVSLAVLTAGVASAATVFPNNSGTTLSLTPLANNAQTFGVGTADGGGYYYTFKTLGNYKVNFTDTGSLNATTLDNPFTVATGSVAGAGTTVATSTFGQFASGVTAVLSAGTYTLYVPTTTVGEGLTGTASVSAVPEPAAWSLMILGLAGIGGAIRRRSRTVALAA